MCAREDLEEVHEGQVGELQASLDLGVIIG